MDRLELPKQSVRLYTENQEDTKSLGGGSVAYTDGGGQPTADDLRSVGIALSRHDRRSAGGAYTGDDDRVGAQSVASYPRSQSGMSFDQVSRHVSGTPLAGRRGPTLTTPDGRTR